MTANAKFDCIILFEDEIRTAAKLVKRFVELDKDVDSEEYLTAARAMVNACFVALQRADEDGICLLLGRKPEGSNVKVTGSPALSASPCGLPG